MFKPGDAVSIERNGIRYSGAVLYVTPSLVVCDLAWGNGAKWQEGIKPGALTKR